MSYDKELKHLLSPTYLISTQFIWSDMEDQLS